MSDNRRVKGTSVLGFLLMPQLRLSFDHFSHIIPVFMRTIAVLFVQAALVPPNHPAMMYGADGVKKCGFGTLMGDAWHTLRTTRARPDQWAVFSSILMMGALVLGAVLRAIMTLGFGFGAAAQAQLFTLSSGAATDAAGIVVGPAPASGALMFDKYIPPADAADGHSDYGIAILDKMLREGMAGQGGQLQKGMRALFETFNTAIMIVAGIMLFWIVLSVVVDTAKTGTIGGGRHNMVWAPIRIIFGLTLLIPLGTAGFSAGQFLVVKIAEWGSNLGSNMWLDYVTAVQNFENIIPAEDLGNQTGLVEQYVDMWVCRTAHNGWTWASTVANVGNDIAFGQEVDFRANQAQAPGKWSYSFSDGVDGNLCGTVILPDDDLNGIYAEPTIAAAHMLGPPTISAAVLAQADFRVAVDNAYVSMFYAGTASAADTTAPAAGSICNTCADQSGLLGEKAQQFACDFVAQHIAGSPIMSPLTQGTYESDVGPGTKICPTAIGACGGGATAQAGGMVGPFPSVGLGGSPSCITDMVTNFYTTVNGQIQTATDNLRDKIGVAMMTDAQTRGWAGMGRWFLQLGDSNATARAALQPPVSITPGSWHHSGNTASALDDKMDEIQAKYSDWWSHAVVDATTQTVQSKNPLAAAANVRSINALDMAPNSIESLAKGLDLNPPKDLPGYMKAIGDMLKGLFDKPFFVDIVAPESPDVYPFSQLAVTGGKILKTGVVLTFAGPYIGMLGGKAAKALPRNGVGDAAALVAVTAGVTIGQITSTIGGLMTMAGAVLSYWVPLIPFIRVLFAVMGWMVSVFEAVALAPIAALAFLTTEGDGLAPGRAREVLVTWLHILVMPALIVIGYIGAIMVFNTFVSYFHDIYTTQVLGTKGEGIFKVLDMIVSTIIYVGTVYVAANASFKMLDVIPAAFNRYLGGHAGNHMADQHGEIKGMIAGGAMNQAMGSLSPNQMQVSSLYDASRQPPPRPGSGGVNK